MRRHLPVRIPRREGAVHNLVGERARRGIASNARKARLDGRARGRPLAARTHGERIDRSRNEVVERHAARLRLAGDGGLLEAEDVREGDVVDLHANFRVRAEDVVAVGRDGEAQADRAAASVAEIGRPRRPAEI